MSRPRRAHGHPVRRVAATLAACAVTATVLVGASGSADARPAREPTILCTLNPATPKRQLRAMWIASAANIDWPSRPGLNVAAQPAEYRAWLDLARRHHLNAVVVQVRPTADAFWPSPYEPWSEWLTGTQGTDPGYDPLAFLVTEAHKRNLEFHAWFNPYRVATHADRTSLAATHPVRRHPDWAFTYGGKLHYDPGIPEVRRHVEDAILHAVTTYDIDGVHFDGQFYPYPVDGATIPDQETFERYGAGFDDIGDWRRHNVNLLVQEMDQRIHRVKPYVKFGISTLGIWRNASTDPLGSDTNGLQSYDAIYADTRTWVTQGWLDYVAPQLSGHIGQRGADYAMLVPWWSNLVDANEVQLYVGQTAYRVGTGGVWDEPTELSRHLAYNRRYPQVAGDIYGSATDVQADRLGVISQLATEHYTRPALIPVIEHLGGTAPRAPTITRAVRDGNGISLAWTGEGTSYAVYRFPGDVDPDPCEFADATHLIRTVRDTRFTDVTAGAQTYTYYVTALDRLHHESPTSVRRVVTGTGGWTTD